MTEDSPHPRGSADRSAPGRAGRDTRSAAETIESLQRQIDNCSVEIVDLKRLLAEANHRIDQTTNSTSWRITSPLRRLVTYAREAGILGRSIDSGWAPFR